MLVCACNKSFNKSSAYASHEKMCCQAKSKRLQQMKQFPVPNKETYVGLLPRYKY